MVSPSIVFLKETKCVLSSTKERDTHHKREATELRSGDFLKKRSSGTKLLSPLGRRWHCWDVARCRTPCRDLINSRTNRFSGGILSWTQLCWWDRVTTSHQWNSGLLQWKGTSHDRSLWHTVPLVMIENLMEREHFSKWGRRKNIWSWNYGLGKGSQEKYGNIREAFKNVLADFFR